MTQQISNKYWRFLVLWNNSEHKFRICPFPSPIIKNAIDRFVSRYESIDEAEDAFKRGMDWVSQYQFYTDHEHGLEGFLKNAHEHAQRQQQKSLETEASLTDFERMCRHKQSQPTPGEQILVNHQLATFLGIAKASNPNEYRYQIKSGSDIFYVSPHLVTRHA